MNLPPVASVEPVGLELVLSTLALLVAALFRPWTSLHHRALQNPWLATLVLLPWLWSVQRLLPENLPLQLSGACLLVLMFGWPLAVVTMLPVAVAGAWLADVSWQRGLVLAFWSGVLPATLALLLGLASRRWLPCHLFVYILARAFFATALAVMLAGLARLAWRPPLPDSDIAALAIGHVLMAWGEAFSTGGLAAIFVAFVPQWLLTYSDARYLPPRQPRG